MKQPMRALCVAAILVLPAMEAASDGISIKGHPDRRARTEISTTRAQHIAEGKIISVGKSGSLTVLTVDQAPVDTMSWPAMVATYTVAGDVALGNIRPGSKVEIEFEHRGSEYVITRLR